MIWMTISLPKIKRRRRKLMRTASQKMKTVKILIRRAWRTPQSVLERQLIAQVAKASIVIQKERVVIAKRRARNCSRMPTYLCDRKEGNIIW
ncbi:hypothetical protein OESDEN_16695 [Oesophagostomum dentatum]|uniref:Uncharacterized protein n=1 Tax=Oesophagostomum dentatum TaxID=61180 RepID=A0A0B1SFB3_OESDE|nr:hypothetical protein OESDEN_16695 [Oesophagostomum dentatum]